MRKTESLDHICSAGAHSLNRTSKLQNKSKFRGSIQEELMKFALSVPDFRRPDKGNIRHRLADIIMLMILGRASGHVARSEIIEFGRHNLNRFRKMGMLRNGVPSEATMCRVEQGIDELSMSGRMRAFAEACHARLLKDKAVMEIICVDGKAMRGTVLSGGISPDIVSAYSPSTGITLATEACHEKSNEIKAVPRVIDRIDVAGKIVTADAMAMQKDIIDRIRKKGGDFLIELKANQRSLRYGIEDRIRTRIPLHSYTEGPELGHGRIETRTYRIHDGLGMIADREKWGGCMTVVEYESYTVSKSTGAHSTERRLYVTSLAADTPLLGAIVRTHWSIESMHWGLDVNLQQDRIRRRSSRSARNLDTIQRIVHSVFSVWKRLRRKMADRRKGMAEIMRLVSASFTKLIRFLCQK